MNGKILEEVYNRNAPYSDRIRIPFLFQGQYYDHETELAYNRFRYYAPELGRYISEDPIRFACTLSNKSAQLDLQLSLKLELLIKKYICIMTTKKNFP